MQQQNHIMFIVQNDDYSLLLYINKYKYFYTQKMKNLCQTLNKQDCFSQNK